MGASSSKQRKSAKTTAKSAKPTKNSKVSTQHPPENTIPTPPSTNVPVMPKSSPLPSPPLTALDDPTLSFTTPPLTSDMTVGIDLYSSGTTPSILIRDETDKQLISSLFPNDIPLSETLASTPPPLHSSFSFSSANSSTISNLSDLFSTASIDTPNSSLSTNSRYSKQFTLTTNAPQHVPVYVDGPSLTQVTPTTDKMNDGHTTRTASDYDSTIHQVHVAQSKIKNPGHDPLLIDQGFNDLLTLASSSCVDAYYPLAECYYLGYHHSSRQPDISKSLHWFHLTVASASSLAPAVIAWAHYRIALLLAKGNHGAAPDIDQALHYFKLSAEHDNRYAQYMLGLHFQHGLFDKHQPHSDLKQALYWYERAARNRFDEAQVSVGQLILGNIEKLVAMQQQQQTKDKWVRIALHWLELAAKQNNVRAHVTLGGIYEEGDLIHRNSSLAMHHYQAATQHSSSSDDKQVILAHYFIGLHYRLGTLVTQNNTKALHHLTIAAHDDYAPAQRALGLMYLEGVAGYLTRNETMAYEWLTKAAVQGDTQSLGLLGQRAERGDHLSSAISMYTRAAQAGSIAAQLSLAHLLLRMDRRAEAYPWFQMAASFSSDGDLRVGYVRQRNVARLMVARYKFNGWDGVVDVDRALAYQEFATLADQDQLPEAYFWMAACYDEGVTDQNDAVVVKRDSKLAFDYYMKSALTGDVDGQFHVALMLANGRGAIEKDASRAFQWYTKAAERGHATAQYSLGLFYERGLSPVDAVQPDKAKFWYERASHQDHTTAMIALAQLLLQEDASSHQDALHWLHKAATKRDDKNYTAALRALAGVFEQGKMAEGDAGRYKKGWLLLQKACDKEDPLAWLDMARYHENGLGVDMDIQAALECLIHAESLGYQKARMAIGDLYYRHKMWNEALTSYESIVKSNVLLKKPGWNARLAIARLLLLEDLQDTDAAKWMPEVYSWLSTMTSQPVGDNVLLEPLELLGMCYESGIGTSKNISSAMDFYKRAINVSLGGMDWIQERTRFRLIELYMATKSHALAWQQLCILKPHLTTLDNHCQSSRILANTARFYIGHLLLHGEASNRNSDEAQLWLTQAADEGDGNAALELAQNLLESDKNGTVAAERRLEQGVSLSHAGCMEALALLLADRGRSKRIMDLLSRAGELGNINAIYHQGRLAYEAYLEDPSNFSHLLDASFDYFMQAVTDGNHFKSMVCIGQLYDSLEQYDNAQIWFEHSSSDPLSSAMLIKYRHDNKCTTDLVTATEQLWTTIDPPVLDTLSRNTIGTLCFFVGQSYHDDDPVLAERWYSRSVNVNPHQAATHALGLLHEAQGDFVTAMDWFRTGAEKWNHAPSQYKLGVYHAHGLGGLDSINLVAAQRYLKLAATDATTHDDAQKQLGEVTFMHAWDLWHTQKQYQRGLKQFEQAALSLDVPEALVALGHLYHTGFLGDPQCLILQSYKQAFTYYSAAARHMNAEAALMLGSYYEEGYLHGMENLDEALTWYEKAYRWNGGALAELAIGKLKHHQASLLLDNDHDAVLDLQEEAYTWFEGAAASSSGLDYGHAKVMMALYHLKGWGRKTCDPSMGFTMLLAIDTAEAMGEVALCYEQGLGVAQDYEKALHYWEAVVKSASDDVLALRKLAELYRGGLAGPCDLEKANDYGARADAIDRERRDEREKSFCSTTTSNSSSSYASRRSSLNSLNQMY